MGSGVYLYHTSWVIHPFQASIFLICKTEILNTWFVYILRLNKYLYVYVKLTGLCLTHRVFLPDANYFHNSVQIICVLYSFGSYHKIVFIIIYILVCCWENNLILNFCTRVFQFFEIIPPLLKRIWIQSHYVVIYL